MNKYLYNLFIYATNSNDSYLYLFTFTFNFTFNDVLSVTFHFVYV